MAAVQRTISFPAKKRVSTRPYKKAVDKENTSKSPSKQHVKLVEVGTPTKRLSNTTDAVLKENGASPPKLMKCEAKALLSPRVNRNLLEKFNDESRLEVSVENVPNRGITCSPHKSKKETDGSGLDQAIRVLHSSQPTKLHGRDDKVEEISTHLLNSLNNRESITLYISGPPGTGKSACVNYIISQPHIAGHFKTVYLNCTGLKTANAAYKKIAHELGLKNESSDKKRQLSIEKHLSTCKKMTLLVMDEMDQLESRRQSLLYTIFEWPSLFKNNLVLIGIANALDLTDRVLPRLQAKLDIAPTLIHFPPYSREEIINILKNRLDEGGVDAVLTGNALHFLASKVAAVSGDIRKALDIGRRVIEMTQNKSDSGKQVSLQDVISVVNNVYGTTASLDTTGNGESFPLHQKLLICVMVLIKKNSKIKEVNLGRLHDVYRNICTKRNINIIEMSEFISIAELVESRGVIRIIGKMKNRLSKVVLLWDDNDITTALQDKNLLASVLDDKACL